MTRKVRKTKKKIIISSTSILKGHHPLHGCQHLVTCVTNFIETLITQLQPSLLKIHLYTGIFYADILVFIDIILSCLILNILIYVLVHTKAADPTTTVRFAIKCLFSLWDHSQTSFPGFLYIYSFLDTNPNLTNKSKSQTFQQKSVGRYIRSNISKKNVAI